MLRAEDNKFLTESGSGTGNGRIVGIVVRRFGDIAGFVGRPRIAAAE
ncbi:hypothetical protein IVB46_12880 [Bradyrhizobium sp. 61]|nr:MULTISPECIES: hypothetical protein [unclassified Bradyrhizobium]MCK1276107.1 hypothetical protein [Bradyrhizobium sp. 61]MCK1446996.1 hypothetical protein [Bradyrhizobium sp. 48]MCK1464778.1 hypothetical protein [Bradyrhizobium sp. 2]